MKNKKWSETFYLRSASSDCGYRWYKYEGEETIDCDFAYEPQAWEMVNSLMVSNKPCLAVVNIKGEVSCIFTGLLSQRRAGTRLIYESIIISTPHAKLSSLQKNVIRLFLFSNINESPLDTLTKAIIDNGLNGVLVNQRSFDAEIESLYNQKIDIELDSQPLFPNYIVKDSLSARRSLARALVAYMFDVSESNIVLVVTKHKSPTLLKNSNVIWGITDYSSAPDINDNPISTKDLQRNDTMLTTDEDKREIPSTWKPFIDVYLIIFRLVIYKKTTTG